jgi:hypothetical protein
MTVRLAGIAEPIIAARPGCGKGPRVDLRFGTHERRAARVLDHVARRSMQ